MISATYLDNAVKVAAVLGSFGTFFAFLLLIKNKALKTALCSLSALFFVGATIGISSTQQHEPKCIAGANLLRYTYPPPNDAYHYTTVATSSPVEGTNEASFKEFRLRQLELLLQKEDSLLRTKNLSAYGHRLYPFFRDPTGLNKRILDNFFSKYYLYVDESLDTAKCSYSLSLSLSHSRIAEIESIIDSVSNLECLCTVIDSMVLPKIMKNGEATITFNQIFLNFCKCCPKDPRVRYWTQRQKNSLRAYDSLYFDKSQFRLSTTSLILLNGLLNSLRQIKSDSLRIECRGYTDPSVVIHQIPYADGASSAPLTTLLPKPGGTDTPMTRITNNDELSFSRGYSSFAFLKENLDNSHISVFYTGFGINDKALPPDQQRSVVIYIKKIR